MVVKTSMPSASSSSASFQRFGWREPAGLACARSSMRITSGRRARATSRSSSPGRAAPSIVGGGRTSKPSSCASRLAARRGSRPRRPPRRARLPRMRCAALEHRVGLAGAGKGAEEDLELAAMHPRTLYLQWTHPRLAKVHARHGRRPGPGPRAVRPEHRVPHPVPVADHRARVVPARRFASPTSARATRPGSPPTSCGSRSSRSPSRWAW